MTNAELARELARMGRRGYSASWQENRTLLEAAARLNGLQGDKARLLSVDEVLGLSPGQVVWEECRALDDAGPGRCYPVMMDQEGRLGDTQAWLSLAGIVRSARRDEDGGQLRWWDRRPGTAVRLRTPWEEVKMDEDDGTASAAGLRDVPAAGDM